MVAQAAERARPIVVGKETILRVTLAAMLALGCVSFIEPSPYEMIYFLLVPVSMMAGLSFTRTTVALYLLAALAVTAELLALSPYLDHHKLEGGSTPVVYTIYSTYLWSSGVLFSMIFARQTVPRLSLALRAYAFSCVFAGVWALLSYFDVAGIGAREPIQGRIAGPFKDPNVLGTYCILGVLVLMQATAFGARRWRLVSGVGLVLALCGVFLSFSRGSWGAMIVATLMFAGASYRVGDRAMRRTIVGGLALLAVAGIGVGTFALSDSTLRTTIQERLQVQQTYDAGVTGRFGNQKRAIPMLMARPFGFGPLRFETYFDLDPHESYLGAFANGGWLGGFAFLALATSSCVLAMRLMLVRTPFQRQALVVAPALIVLFLQALQIDIDHWRFLWLMIGAVWGMESARVALHWQQARERRPMAPLAAGAAS